MLNMFVVIHPKSLCMAGQGGDGGKVGHGGEEEWWGGWVGGWGPYLVVGGDLCNVSLMGETVLQTLLQLVHMLFYIVNTSSRPLHSPAMLSCKAICLIGAVKSAHRYAIASM